MLTKRMLNAALSFAFLAMALSGTLSGASCTYTGTCQCALAGQAGILSSVAGQVGTLTSAEPAEACLGPGTGCRHAHDASMPQALVVLIVFIVALAVQVHQHSQPACCHLPSP